MGEKSLTDLILSAMARLAVILAFWTAAVSAAAAAPVGDGAELRDVRFGVTSTTKTRIVLDLAGAPVFTLKGDGAGEGRLFIELSNLSSVKPTARTAKGRGHIAAARYVGGPKPRISMTLKRSARVVEAFVIPPSAQNPLHRLVVDLESADKKAFLASVKQTGPRTIEDVIAAATKKPAAKPAKKPSAASKPAPKKVAAATKAKPKPAPVAPKTATAEGKPTAPARKPKRARRPAIGARKYVVVIDAGHGGRDPGATGPSGVKEKVVTFAAAEALRARLRATGRYEVVLTRVDDKKLAYLERTRIAREADADLFISLHADAIAKKNVRGASVYTLSKEGTARSAEEAREEGDLVVFGTDVGQNEDVQNILFDLAQQHTENESDRFAEILISHLGGVTPLVNNSHREANLAVLLAPDVPAVLLELGFISNVADEKNLNSPSWRRKTMAAVAAAIDAYFADAPLERQALAR